MSGETEEAVSGWTVDTLKALHEQRFTAMDKALALQSGELSRRLDILNHAHEKAVEVQHTYVPREVFEKALEALEARFDEYKATTNRALILREGQSRGVGLTANVFATVVTVLVAIIGIVLAIFVATH
jgi:predicted ATPase